ncbi:MAG: amidohydrolase, partial [bacterium]
MTKLNRISSLFFILTMLAGCQQDRADHTADISSPGESSSPTNATLFVGGDVVTVDENYPNAEAVAVGEGKILAVGKTLEVQEFLAEAGYTADIRDLDGMTLAPGFIDAHGHISFVASTISAVDLQPSPAGNTDSIETMLSKLDEWHQNNPGKWVEGWGYDDSLLVENRHPTRADLDKVSTDVPIVLRHVSGHLAAANSKMLEIAGISAESEDPPGGHIQRMPGTNEPNGVLEESAWFAVTAMLPKPSKDEELEHLIAAQEYYASRGITTVQDGAALEPEIPVYREAAAQGKLYLDIVSFPAFFGPMRMGENFDFSQTYSDH